MDSGRWIAGAAGIAVAQICVASGDEERLRILWRKARQKVWCF
jgi:hypothetical protein